MMFTNSFTNCLYIVRVDTFSGATDIKTGSNDGGQRYLEDPCEVSSPVGKITKKTV